MKDKYSAAFQDAMEYTDLMEAVEKEFSSSILPSMVGQLPTLAFSQMRFGLMAASGSTGMSADAGAKKLQKAIDDMRSDLEKYENIYEECSRIANRKGKKPYWVSQMDLEKVQKQSERIRQAKEKLSTIKGGSSDAWRIMTAAQVAAQTVAGFISEQAATNIANAAFEGNKTISLGNGFTLQVIQSGAEAGKKGKQKKGYRVQTTDLSIAILDESGTIVLTLPGLSLKRTATGMTGANPMYKIHIKSSSIGNLIANAGIQANSAFDLGSFYNYYANHGRTTHRMGADNSEVTNKVTNMNQMYKAFHSAMLLTAMAGGIKADDFAYFLAINDRIYSADEVIKMALSGDATIVGGMTKKLDIDDILKGGGTTLSKAQPAIAAHHSNLFASLKDPDSPDSEESRRRSDAIIGAINNISLVLNLNIALKDLI